MCMSIFLLALHVCKYFHAISQGHMSLLTVLIKNQSLPRLITVIFLLPSSNMPFFPSCIHSCFFAHKCQTKPFSLLTLLSSLSPTHCTNSGHSCTPSPNPAVLSCCNRSEPAPSEERARPLRVFTGHSIWTCRRHSYGVLLEVKDTFGDENKNCHKSLSKDNILWMSEGCVIHLNVDFYTQHKKRY